MEVYTFTVGPFSENTYLLVKQGEGLLVDPGFYSQAEFATFQQKVDKLEVNLKAVLITHAHVDHVLGLHRVITQFDLPVYLSEKDRYLWRNFHKQSKMFGLNTEPFNFEPETLPVQPQWDIYSFTFDTLYTPGHAPDHVALYNKEQQLLIAGDTLFKEGIGRTDLYKGNFEQLEQSIKEGLYSLSDETKVYPGHGPSTTIGHEKQNNPFVSVIKK